jgi:hypothetical protein
MLLPSGVCFLDRIYTFSCGSVIFFASRRSREHAPAHYLPTREVLRVERGKPSLWSVAPLYPVYYVYLLHRRDW